MMARQTTLSQRQPYLVLAIHPIHVERIFKGVKQFELRRTLPKQFFSKVFLYKTGGGGIVGCFDAGKAIKAPVHELWTIVGEKATTHERFLRYFSESEIGFAIPIRNPVRFKEEICPPALKRLVPQFTAPMSYLVIRPEQVLYRVLEDKRREETTPIRVMLEPIRKRDYNLFVDLITSEISAKYEGITEKFARAILKTNQIGFDPNGIFTTRKRVFAIKVGKGRLVGFTTLTYKIGGCAKTGPTVILPRFRNRGIGSAARRELTALAKREGIRKLYCTCPDNDPAVCAYLLRAGFRIEAHLQKQYSASHGELVLGRFVRANRKNERTRIRRSSLPAKDSTNLSLITIADFFRRNFRQTWVPISAALAKSITRASRELNTAYEEKPLQMYCIGSHGRCSALALLVPKRGGAVKALLLTATLHSKSLMSLIKRLENHLRVIGKRKLYFVHPWDDYKIIDLLKSCGYKNEGLLQEPYRRGQNAVVFAKMFRRA